MSFEEAVREIKPDVLIGASGQPRVFTKDIVSFLASVHEHPVVFALSNPTSKAECTAEEAYKWSDGRAVFASGSPFGVVHVKGEIKVPGQGNNAYIFPGLGLGALLGKVTRISDEMLIVSAQVLAECVSNAEIEQGCMYPPLSEIREVSVKIAGGVAQAAEKLGDVQAPLPSDFEKQVRDRLYQPYY